MEAESWVSERYGYGPHGTAGRDDFVNVNSQVYKMTDGASVPCNGTTTTKPTSYPTRNLQAVSQSSVGYTPVERKPSSAHGKDCEATTKEVNFQPLAGTGRRVRVRAFSNPYNPGNGTTTGCPLLWMEYFQNFHPGDKSKGTETLRVTFSLSPLDGISYEPGITVIDDNAYHPPCPAQTLAVQNSGEVGSGILHVANRNVTLAIRTSSALLQRQPQNPAITMDTEVKMRTGWRDIGAIYKQRIHVIGYKNPTDPANGTMTGPLPIIVGNIMLHLPDTMAHSSISEALVYLNERPLPHKISCYRRSPLAAWGGQYPVLTHIVAVTDPVYINNPVSAISTSADRDSSTSLDLWAQHSSPQFANARTSARTKGVKEYRTGCQSSSVRRLSLSRSYHIGIEPQSMRDFQDRSSLRAESWRKVPETAGYSLTSEHSNEHPLEPNRSHFRDSQRNCFLFSENPGSTANGSGFPLTSKPSELISSISQPESLQQIICPIAEDHTNDINVFCARLPIFPETPIQDLSTGNRLDCQQSAVPQCMNIQKPSKSQADLSFLTPFYKPLKPQLPTWAEIVARVGSHSDQPSDCGSNNDGTFVHSPIPHRSPRRGI